MNTDEKDVAEVIEHMTVLVQSPGQNIGNIHKIQVIFTKDPAHASSY